LNQAHDSLGQQLASQRPASSPPSPPTGTPETGKLAGSRGSIAALKALSEDQKTLADLSRRMQDMQDVQTAYGNWIALVGLHQLAVIHSMIESALWICLIILVVYLADRAVDRSFTSAGGERTRLHTVRVVARFAVQASGVLLIFIVVFGVPQ